MDLNEILQNLPHVFPFRLIDRILEIEPGKKAIALKNVSEDDLFLQGHFQKEPIVPGVLIAEALAQTGGLAFHSIEKKGTGGEEVPYLAAIDQFRLRRKVIPGDQIILEAEVLYVFSHLAKVKVRASVGGETVAEGIFVLAKNPSPQTLP
jgi:3-hydroxyacyl-[acyl-carrier-protein] dehydratase